MLRHLFGALAVAVLAQQAPAAPVCALLDPEKLPQAALLESKLVAEPGTTWVERTDIDKLLKEQKLQAAFGPQGVGERVKFGRLLKADVLVTVRTVKNVPEPALEVAVSETAGGLRLLVRAVPVTKNPDTDVASLLGAVKDGIGRHGEAIREVVAVPPFVSHDLEFTHDHLRAALAKLAEAEALDRRGVVVVELEEAEALARELALTAPGAKLDRPLPVYLLGEYRNDGRGGDRTLFVKMRAERGGKLVGKPFAEILKPDAAPGAVREWAASTLDALARDGKPRPPADPRAEAKTLADRARVFARLGNWSEAFGLIEASLLLDPNQTELRVEALRVLGPLMEKSWNSFSPKIEEVRKVRPLYRRGLEHLEIATFRDELLPGKNTGVPVTGRFLHAGSGLHCATASPEVKAELAEMRQERRELLLRMLPDLVKRGKGEEVTPIRTIIAFMPDQERFAQVEQLILQFQDLPQATSRTVLYAELVRPEVLPFAPYTRPNEDAGYRAFLDRLSTAKNADVRTGAALLKTRWDTAIAAKRDAGVVGTPTTNEVSLKPIEFSFPAEKAPIFNPGGITAAGEGVDVVWGDDALYLMKKKGELRRVWSAREQSVYFAAVCFDGRYVWATTRRYQKWATLLILDPATEKVWEVTGADGLPQGTAEQQQQLGFHHLLVAPVEPGRACVAGSFGRTWIATVTFDAAAGKPTVKMLHEAREAQDPRDAGQADRATIDFVPTFMFTLRTKPDPGAKPEVRVVLGRGKPLPGHGTPNAAVSRRPLIIDPDRPGVDVAGTVWGDLPTDLVQIRFRATDDAAYFSRYVAATQGNPEGAEVLRVAAPGVVPQVVVRGLPVGTGTAFAHADRLHAIQFTDAKPGPDGRFRNTSVWWTAGPDGKNLRSVAAGLPVVEGAFTSSHYGLVVLLGAEPMKPRTLNVVEFVAPKK